ncbi:multiple inositol polyphosphate phosphatase 1 isoform X3 [Salmo salar]|uniref:Multiple inositol polyphosphate phosphatase 1 isoform X3 n=1 Tax=Salmo salar TaxID=8030 RepID=A0A1S3N400_SALSA|nr:multiple inositol polyphosphate phosphatase 1 isoform X3 [Salmo salar]|eukprot:XP_014010117.1 PREDICTED: multiple inositol polyphosphate phosphatase 1-like isoform X3 [Salmo salar]
MLLTIPLKVIIAHFFFSYISCCSLWRNVLTTPDIPAIAKYFTTKGRYEEVNPYLIDDILAVNKSLVKPPSAECREIHLTAIIRHGSRYPTIKNVKKMRELHNLVVQKASGEERWLREITQWKMWYTDEMDGRLVQKGVLDHRHLAVRLSKLFPSLISKEKLQDGHIKFMTSSKHRCVNSTLSFQGGLAKLWAIEDMAEAAFYLCAYELAIKTINSPWCQLFDEADALHLPHKQVLEYANDLKQFWKRSYGHDINSKSSCILFHDVFSRLDRAANEIRSGSNVTEAATIQVGHADTLLPLLTLLGFFKDSVPLTSNNYVTQGQRAFRTSRMMPYAANLVLVLYDCSGNLRLQALLNERPLAFPGLATNQGEEGAPLYQDVRDHYGELLQGCDFEKECQLFPSK